VTHVSDATDIPTSNWFIEVFTVEYTRHVSDIADVPALHFTIGSNSCPAIILILINGSLESGLISKHHPATAGAGVEGKASRASSLDGLRSRLFWCRLGSGLSRLYRDWLYNRSRLHRDWLLRCWACWKWLWL
jgi:hypothetical protein